MNRKVCKLLLLSAISLFTAACSNDIDRFLDNPYWIHAEFNPSYGIPLGHGEIALEDIIDKVGGLPEEVSITYNNHNIVTLNYATIMHNEIPVELENSDAKRRKSGTKDSREEEIFVFTDTIPFDLRSQFGEFIPDSEQLQLNNIFLSLASNITTDASANTFDAIERWGINFQLDTAIVYGHNTATEERFVLAELTEGLMLTDILSENGFHDTLFNKQNFGEILSRNFNEISYRIVLRVHIPVQTDLVSVSQFMQDSLEMTKFVMDNNIAVEYPVTGMISDLGYDFNVQMKTGEIETYGIGIDTAQLVLEIENGIPLELCLQAQLVDSLGNTLCNAFPNCEYDTIGAARTKWNTESQSHITESPTTSVHYISLNDERFGHLQNTRNIQVSIAASTSHDETDGSRKMVSLRGQDHLKIRAYVQATPRYSFDTIIHLK